MKKVYNTADLIFPSSTAHIAGKTSFASQFLRNFPLSYKVNNRSSFFREKIFFTRKKDKFVTTIIQTSQMVFT